MRTRGRWDSRTLERSDFDGDIFVETKKSIPLCEEGQKTPGLSAATRITDDSHSPTYWQALLLFPENWNY